MAALQAGADDADVARWALEHFDAGAPSRRTSRPPCIDAAVAAAAAVAVWDEFAFQCEGEEYVVQLLLPAAAVGVQLAFSERTWRGCLVHARALARNPKLVRGRRVLELGCGTAVCGLLAAQLGAASVLLTDCSCEGLKALLPSVAHARGGGHCGGGGDGSDDDRNDEGVGGSWGDERAGVWVRRHLWENDVPRSPGRAPPRHWSAPEASRLHGMWEGAGPPPELGAAGGAGSAAGAPAAALGGGAFGLVVCSDCLYFHGQVVPLLATIAARLCAGGAALLAVTVRNRSVHRAFIEGLPAFGLRVVADCEVAVAAADVAYLDDPARVAETANAKEVRLLQVARAEDADGPLLER